MKPPREQRQEGGEGSSRAMNRGKICLDGEDGEEAVPSYTAGIDSILAWCLANGIVKDVSHIFGPNAVVFTTPPKGTFYMDVESTGRCLEVLINGRDLYLMGWRGPNGSFEIKSDTQPRSKKKSDIRTVNYMIGSDIRIVDVSKNYSKLSPKGDVRNTKLGIYEFRQAFDALFNYRGGSTGTIKEALGIFAVCISEATRLQGAFDTVCASFRFPKVSRLHKWTFEPLWINRYGHYCKQGMIQIDHRMNGLVPPPIKVRDIEVESAEDIIKEIRVFHIDAYDEGMFEHDPELHAKPEMPVEEPCGASPSQGVNRGNNHRRTGKDGANKTGKQSKKGVEAVAPSYVPDFPPRRRYQTWSPVSTFPPLQLDDWRESVQRNSRVRDFLSSSRKGLKQMGATVPQLSECMAQFPALQKLCKVNYKMMRQQREIPLSLQSSARTTACRQHGAHSSSMTFSKLKSKVKTSLWSLHASFFPTVEQKKRQAVVTQKVVATQHLSTGYVKLEARVLPHKPPIQQAGALLSRLLRVLRR